MTEIQRRRVVEETVVVPDGHVVCGSCGGRGKVSKYEMGWRSMGRSEDLAALRDCGGCGGEGYLPRLPRLH